MNIDNLTVLYRRGDNLTFTFNITINATRDLDTLNISIWSPTLEFPDSNVQWKLKGLDIDPGIGSEPQLDSASAEVADELVDNKNEYRLHLTNIKTNRWRFDGIFSVTVRDDVGPGRRVQSFMTISSFVLEPNSTSTASSTTVISSSYGRTPPIQVNLNPPPSAIIGIMKTASLNVSLTLETDNTAPLVEIISPFENTSREVMLTIQEAKVNETYGFEPNTVQDISQTKPELISTLMTYQKDFASVQLPVLKKDINVSKSGLAAEFNVRLEDYTLMENGDDLKVGAGVTFGDDMIWISEMTLTVDAPDAANRKPFLELVTWANPLCAGEDRNDVELILDIKHGSNSTATAYDLQLNLFPLPSMSSLGLTAYTISPTDYTFILNTSEYICITLGRLTFSDPAKVSLRMRVQMNESYINDATHFIIPVELIYNDRWNDSVDSVTPLKYIDLKLNKKCAERYTWTSESTCTCNYNGSRSDCGCCIDHDVINVTQCGQDNPGVCAPQHMPWLCWWQINEFLSHSRLQGFSGETYECDPSQKYSRQRNSEISCYKATSNGYREVHPMAAIVLGKDSATSTLYGVSSMGHAYVVSEDGGQSWCTIRESIYLTATSSTTYSPATFF